MDYKCQVASMPSYAVSGDRRGGLGCDASGKREPVVLTSVTKQNKESLSPTGMHSMFNVYKKKPKSCAEFN